ncbi:hypothetical protein IV498_11765 [Paenarthrobacter sp. Z7-10]|nr:hypothetical protein [Paenarthrobacter sp. Z7-10]
MGAVIVAWLTLGHYTVGSVLPFLPAAVQHINVGVLALLANIIVCAAVSAGTRGHTQKSAKAPSEVPAGV